MRVLLIEDNADLAANIYDYLAAEGHTMDAAGDGITGLHLAVVNDYDVIVLDLALPGMDGLDVCRRLREEAQKDIPIIMLTARDTLEDKLSGFAAGADDYLVKPFSLEELNARLVALGRRTRPDIGKRLQVADLILDNDLMEVTRGGERLDLTPIQIRILARLMQESPRVVRKNDMETHVWGDDPPDSDALRAHIHALRTAIDKPFATPLLQTVRGIGYRLAKADEN